MPGKRARSKKSDENVRYAGKQKAYRINPLKPGGSLSGPAEACIGMIEKLRGQLAPPAELSLRLGTISAIGC
jgi:hypothetical protein